MKLIPFNSDFGPYIHQTYYNSFFRDYYRGYIHGLSMKDASLAEEYFKMHILIGLSDETDKQPISGTPIGAITFADTDKILRIYKLGLLVDPKYQKRGFGYELLNKGLNWAFDTMNSHIVFGEFLESNERILKGAMKAGFRNEGTRLKTVFMDGKFHNEIRISMLQSEYRASLVKKVLKVVEA